MGAYENQAGPMIIELGNGDGTFTYKSTFAFPAAAVGLVAADFNSDGILDLALTDVFGGTVTVYLGNGDGTFTRKSVQTSYGVAAVADMNGDGIPDLVTAFGFGVRQCAKHPAGKWGRNVQRSSGGRDTRSERLGRRTSNRCPWQTSMATVYRTW